jgi:pyruvate dehydrogenase E2 component (dihydrolipoamide acetyltransferase)
VAHRIVMPTFGMYTVEATLSRWLVPAGSRVESGDPIVEIEAEKATYEVEAPASGIVHPVAQEGEGLTVEGLIGWILEEGEEIPSPPSSPAFGRPVLSLPPGEGRPLPDRNALSSGIKASPAARRLAAEKGVDLASLKGTGPGGRIVEADVLAAAQARKET